ncbi:MULTISPECIES: hypothetical protein [Nocardia]|uniref:hypothetical protein n=1 Tax=Nocardia TaxID=1817 RepID=UPI000D68D3DF|nr:MULTISPECIES: hypothetical protein [Nocardia]
MVSSRAKIAGPAIAVGAVSLGLVLIGACGVGHHDIYVPPPPLELGPAAAVATMRDGSTVTVPKVIIPPSPTWQMAPAGPPRRPAGYTPPSSTSPGSEPDSATESPESSTRPGRTSPTRTTTPPATHGSDTEETPTTTRTRTQTADPTTVEESVPTTRAQTSTEEAAALEETRTEDSSVPQPGAGEPIVIEPTNAGATTESPIAPIPESPVAESTTTTEDATTVVPGPLVSADPTATPR